MFLYLGHTEVDKTTIATTAEITTTDKVTEATERTTQISTVDISNDVKNLSTQVVDLENQLSKGKQRIFWYLPKVLSSLFSFQHFIGLFPFYHLCFQISMRCTRN